MLPLRRVEVQVVPGGTVTEPGVNPMVSYLRKLPRAHEPGTTFNYNTGNQLTSVSDPASRTFAFYLPLARRLGRRHPRARGGPHPGRLQDRRCWQFLGDDGDLGPVLGVQPGDELKFGPGVPERK